MARYGLAGRMLRSPLNPLWTLGSGMRKAGDFGAAANPALLRALEGGMDAAQGALGNLSGAAGSLMGAMAGVGGAPMGAMAGGGGGGGGAMDTMGILNPLIKGAGRMHPANTLPFALQDAGTALMGGSDTPAADRAHQAQQMAMLMGGQGGPPPAPGGGGPMGGMAGLLPAMGALGGQGGAPTVNLGEKIAREGIENAPQMMGNDLVADIGNGMSVDMTAEPTITGAPMVGYGHMTERPDPKAVARRAIEPMAAVAQQTVQGNRQVGRDAGQRMVDAAAQAFAPTPPRPQQPKMRSVVTAGPWVDKNPPRSSEDDMDATTEGNIRRAMMDARVKDARARGDKYLDLPSYPEPERADQQRRLLIPPQDTFAGDDDYSPETRKRLRDIAFQKWLERM